MKIKEAQLHKFSRVNLSVSALIVTHDLTLQGKDNAHVLLQRSLPPSLVPLQVTAPYDQYNATVTHACYASQCLCNAAYVCPTVMPAA